MRKVKVKTDSYSIIKDTLYSAAERACNRCDKYNNIALTEGQRNILIAEFENSFWIALSDNNAEIA